MTISSPILESDEDEGCDDTSTQDSSYRRCWGKPGLDRAACWDIWAVGECPRGMWSSMTGLIYMFPRPVSVRLLPSPLGVFRLVCPRSRNAMYVR